jgi:hypothetical protein
MERRGWMSEKSRDDAQLHDEKRHAIDLVRLVESCHVWMLRNRHDLR